jgi:septal ring factor EnvC (AmiA/AmiB activator)
MSEETKQKLRQKIESLKTQIQSYEEQIKPIAQKRQQSIMEKNEAESQLYELEPHKQWEGCNCSHCR